MSNKGWFCEVIFKENEEGIKKETLRKCECGCFKLKYGNEQKDTIVCLDCGKEIENRRH